MTMLRFPNFRNFQSLFQEVERMKSEMDRMLAGVMGRSPLAVDSGVFPALNVFEDGGKIHVNAELPGVKPEDIEISVQGNTLTIRGSRRLDGMESVNYHRRERTSGEFHKALTLPVDINQDAVEAKCEHGVLKLVLPKAEYAKPKKIPVRTGNELSGPDSVVDVSS